MSKLCSQCQYFAWATLLSSSALILFDMEITKAPQVVTWIAFHSSIMTSRNWWMSESLNSFTSRLKIPHRCLIGFSSGDILDHSITFTFSVLREVSRHFGGLFGCVIVLLNCHAAQFLKGREHALLQKIIEHIGIHVSLIDPSAPQCRQQSYKPRQWHCHLHAWL